MDVFRGMQVFVEVAERQSLRLAAKAQQISPAMVTRHINYLEERLGCRLIHRTTRSFALTEEGQVYYQHCRDVFEAMDKVEARLVSADTQPKGRVRLDVNSHYAMSFIIPALSDFFVQYPEIGIDIRQTEHQYDTVYNGFDIAVRVGRFKNSNLIARRMSSKRVVNVASPSYLKRYGIPKTPDDLINHRCINYADPFTGRILDWVFEYEGKPYGFNPPGSLSFNDGEARLGAAIAGLGIAQVLEPRVDELIRTGHLQVILANWTAPSEQTFLLYPKAANRAPRIKAVVDYLLKLYPPSKHISARSSA